jgi:hypothetical protein
MLNKMNNNNLLRNQKNMPQKPYFLITIDTEGDNLWANPKEVSTKNASYLFRFQELLG